MQVMSDLFFYKIWCNFVCYSAGVQDDNSENYELFFLSENYEYLEYIQLTNTDKFSYNRHPTMSVA